MARPRCSVVVVEFGAFFAVEVPLACVFFLLTRKWRYQVWAGAVVLLLHYTLWTDDVSWTLSRISLWPPKLFYFVFPCFGLAWLFYSRMVADPQSRGRVAKP
jgi:hypothetical protein